jgi:hypothetical protein
LTFNDRPVLAGAGSRTLKDADDHAEKQDGLFEARRREGREAAGEAEVTKLLEGVAKRLPKKK